MQKIQSQAADEPGSLPSRQPRSQATRQIGTCRQPGQQPRNKERRSEQASDKPASQPACQPSSQDTTQQASQPSSQPARQKQKQSKQKGREAHRNSNTHSQAGALLAQLLRDTPSVSERDSIAKPLGSQCKPCLTETKHDQKQ